LTTNNESQYSVVLDPQEYNPNMNMNMNMNMNGGGIAGGVGIGGIGMMNAMNMGNNVNLTNAGYMPIQNGAYTNGNYIIWPSTKAHR
jgi:isocitrate dehydrogenase